MTMLSPRPVLVAGDAEIEPLLRSSRATVAMLSLKVRTTLHEVEQAESSGDGDRWAAATTVLQASLDELVERRRSELGAALDAERRAADAVVEAARREAAEMLAARQVVVVAPETPSTVAGPALESVPADIPVDVEAPEVDDDEPAADVEPEVVEGAVEIEEPEIVEVADAPEVEAILDAPQPAVVERCPDEVDLPTSAVPSAAPVPGIPSAEAFAELFQNALAAGLAQAVAGMTASVPVVASPTVVVARRPLWRRLLYIDVVLPLVAVAVVVVVLLAWVG